MGIHIALMDSLALYVVTYLNLISLLNFRTPLNSLYELSLSQQLSAGRTITLTFTSNLANLALNLSFLKHHC